MSTSEDGAGQLLFPASVERVESDGSLLLQYFRAESDGSQVFLERGRELPEWVSPRVQMPWHPTHLRDILKIFLRRNVGHGKVIEGLEVRWGLVVRVLQALARLGTWNDDGRMVRVECMLNGLRSSIGSGLWNTCMRHSCSWRGIEWPFSALGMTRMMV